MMFCIGAIQLEKVTSNQYTIYYYTSFCRKSKEFFCFELVNSYPLQFVVKTL